MTPILPVIFCAFYLLVQANAWTTCDDDSYCVKIDQCPNLVRKIKHLHATNYTLHRQFMVGHVLRITCGSEEKFPKVCCSLEEGRKIIKSESDKCGSFSMDKILQKNDSSVESESMEWLALLEYETHSGKKFDCGGALISNRYVLTAAHCLSPYINAKLVSVHLSKGNDCKPDDSDDNKSKDSKDKCNNKTVVVGIEEQIPHEDYSFLRGPSDFSLLTYDIALLRLDREIKFPTICLPGKEPGKINLIAGWGAMPLSDGPLFNEKHVTIMTDVDKKTCSKNYTETLEDDVLCSKTKSQQSCIGDAGGPLMALNGEDNVEVVGIFSPRFPIFCKQNSVPGTYTDVRTYINWIYTHMRH